MFCPCFLTDRSRSHVAPGPALIFDTCVAPAGEQLRLSLEDCHAALMGQARPGKLLGRNWMAKPPNRCARRLYQSAPGASVDKQTHQVHALCAQWWTISGHKSLAGNQRQTPVDRDISVEVRPPYSTKLLIASIFYTLWRPIARNSKAFYMDGSRTPKAISGPKIGFGIRLALAKVVSLTTFRRRQMRGLGSKL